VPLRAIALRLPLLLALACACGAEPIPPEAPRSERAASGVPGDRERARVQAGDGVLRVELALDDATRWRGLSGRDAVPPDGGMLFAWPDARPRAMVMRHCPVPLDLAFLDAGGRVVALHTMSPEPPRRPDESPFEYASRLPEYASGAPVPFALETAGGRLGELGVEVGDRLVFDARGIRARAR